MARQAKGDQSPASKLGTGGQGAQERSGAVFKPRYYDRDQQVTVVSVSELRNLGTSSIEEFWQFAFGEFLVAGSFWLGIERFFTVENWKTDALFWVCVVAFISGFVIGLFGYRQLSRRYKEVERIIDSATARHD